MNSELTVNTPQPINNCTHVERRLLLWVGGYWTLGYFNAVDDLWTESISEDAIHPTHWLPLPEPPTPKPKPRQAYVSLGVGDITEPSDEYYDGKSWLPVGDDAGETIWNTYGYHPTRRRIPNPEPRIMNTILTQRLPDHAADDRRTRIIEALASGKVARFHYTRPGGQSFHKDVNEFAPDGDGDIVSFRRTGGATHWVCWDSPELSLEIVDPKDECADCDALCSDGFNDGPCERHTP
jgi:hypothetical protein